MTDSAEYQPKNAVEELLTLVRNIGDEAAICQVQHELREAGVPAWEVDRLHGVVNHASRNHLKEVKADIPEATCDFCQRPQKAVFWLVQGPLATICDRCVEVARTYVQAARALKGKPKWYRRLWWLLKGKPSFIAKYIDDIE